MKPIEKQTAHDGGFVSSALLGVWVMSQENKPEERPNPKQRIEHAVNIAEKVAYAKGLRDGLDRLERIALLIPNRTLTGPVLIKMAQNEIRYAIKKWQDADSAATNVK